MTADYCNQETERFRKLQAESVASCDGNFSPVTQVYDIGNALCTSVLGFFLYFGILLQLNVGLVLFLVLISVVSYLLNKRVTQWLGDVYQENIKGLSGWYRRYTKKVFGVALCDGGLSILREAVAYMYLLYLVFLREISVADFILFFGVITGFSAWLSGMFGQVTSLQRISMTVNILRTFLEYPDDYLREGGLWTEGLRTAPKEIFFSDVSYRYEGAEQDTLSGFNLTIAPKEYLAVVGLNGAGKTTMVKLLCGLTDPTEGMVCYDGIDIREYNRDKYYELFSAVFQQFSLLPVTIAEAVAEEEVPRINRERVEACLKKAGLWEKIVSLEKGMDSEYGKAVNDKGTELSGGQIQKLLLARALYRNAPIMVLDEPTAALDPIAEAEIYTKFNGLVGDKTAIYISHRLSSCKFCDEIVVFEDGAVVQRGSHEALIQEKSGLYHALWMAQAQYYEVGNVQT